MTFKFLALSIAIAALTAAVSSQDRWTIGTDDAPCTAYTSDNGITCYNQMPSCCWVNGRCASSTLLKLTETCVYNSYIHFCYLLNQTDCISDSPPTQDSCQWFDGILGLGSGCLPALSTNITDSSVFNSELLCPAIRNQSQCKSPCKWMLTNEEWAASDGYSCVVNRCPNISSMGACSTTSGCCWSDSNNSCVSTKLNGGRNGCSATVPSSFEYLPPVMIQSKQELDLSADESCSAAQFSYLLNNAAFDVVFKSDFFPVRVISRPFLNGSTVPQIQFMLKSRGTIGEMYAFAGNAFKVVSIGSSSVPTNVTVAYFGDYSRSFTTNITAIMAAEKSADLSCFAQQPCTGYHDGWSSELCSGHPCPDCICSPLPPSPAFLAIIIVPTIIGIGIIILLVVYFAVWRPRAAANKEINVADVGGRAPSGSKGVLVVTIVCVVVSVFLVADSSVAQNAQSPTPVWIEVIVYKNVSTDYEFNETADFCSPGVMHFYNGDLLLSSTKTTSNCSVNDFTADCQCDCFCLCGTGRPYIPNDDGVPIVADVDYNCSSASDWSAHHFAEYDLKNNHESDADRSAKWLQIALGEHASISSFSVFSLQLMSVGAPADLINRAHVAALDEVRHAQNAFALASYFDPQRRTFGPNGFKSRPHSISVSGKLVDMCEAVIREGCVDETLSVLKAEKDIVETTSLPEIEALNQVMADESNHAMLAWDTAKWCLSMEGKSQETNLRERLENALKAQMETLESRFGSSVASEGRVLLEKLRQVVWSRAAAEGDCGVHSACGEDAIRLGDVSRRILSHFELVAV